MEEESRIEHENLSLVQKRETDYSHQGGLKRNIWGWCLEFHDHAKETDPKKVEMYIRDAEAGLKQIQQYTKTNHHGSLSYTIG